MAKKVSFEERMERLEGIVRGLEDGELELDKAVDQYQAGMKLLGELQTHLGKMEKKIEELTSDGSTKALPDPEDDESGGDQE